MANSRHAGRSSQGLGEPEHARDFLQKGRLKCESTGKGLVRFFGEAQKRLVSFRGGDSGIGDGGNEVALTPPAPLFEQVSGRGKTRRGNTLLPFGFAPPLPLWEWGSGSEGNTRSLPKRQLSHGNFQRRPVQRFFCNDSRQTGPFNHDMNAVAVSACSFDGDTTGFVQRVPR